MLNGERKKFFALSTLQPLTIEMKKAFFIACYFLIVINTSYAITITEGTYNGIEHFIVYTKNVTYYYDKAGGAFSRIVDRNGNDWVKFNKNPWQKTPQSAASSFRGVPNLVDGNSGGIGYPGQQNCVSEKKSRKVIETRSIDGKWQWIWTFNNNYAELTIEKVDPDVLYKFMYNGVIGGKFNPENQYYGSSLGGPYFEIYDFNKGEKLYGNWLWMYLGDRDIKRVIFMAMKKPDHQLDSFSFMGDSEKGIFSENGMSTFGFGVKEDFVPLLKEEGNQFVIGIIEKRVEKPNDHLKIKRIIEGFLK